MFPGSDLLATPGRPGPFGAIVDETARAADGYCRALEVFSMEQFIAERPSPDPDTVSLRALARHVQRAAYGYASYIVAARQIEPPTEIAWKDRTIETPADVRPRVREALLFTELALDGLWDIDEAQLEALKFNVRWGPTYDPEMILEHGICHFLRHRRQIERWDQ